MSSVPPDPTETMLYILQQYWDNDNCPTPYFFTPATEKRLPMANKDVVGIYSVLGEDRKEGIMNAFRTRIDYVTIDASTTDRDRFQLLWKEIIRILDLPAVRSSPPTKPDGADAYDQFIPTAHKTMEDRNRQWWRLIIEGEFRGYWDAR